MLNWKPRLSLKLLTGELSGMWMESCVYQDSDQWQASRVHFVLEGSYSYTSVFPFSATKSYWYWKVPITPSHFTSYWWDSSTSLTYSKRNMIVATFLIHPCTFNILTDISSPVSSVEHPLQTGLPLERCMLTSLLSSQEHSPLEHRLQVQPRHQPLQTHRQVRLHGQTKKLHTLKESIA